jgi:hypothetical protein
MAKKRKRVVKRRAPVKRRRNPPSKRKQRKMVARVRWADKPNPPKMKRVNKSTAWIPATSVKIRKNKGKYEVLIRRKRPARRKTARRR